MGSTDLFFENVCIIEQVSRSLLGTGAGGVTRETDSICSNMGARRAGHGARARAGLAAGAPPVDSQSGEPNGAEIGRARPA